jgi:hypothetical protein
MRTSPSGIGMVLLLMIRTYGKGPGAGTLAKTQEVMALVYPRFLKLIEN